VIWIPVKRDPEGFEAREDLFFLSCLIYNMGFFPA
jgi:hypothetical protein